LAVCIRLSWLPASILSVLYIIILYCHLFDEVARGPGTSQLDFDGNAIASSPVLLLVVTPVMYIQWGSSTFSSRHWMAALWCQGKHSKSLLSSL